MFRLLKEFVTPWFQPNLYLFFGYGWEPLEHVEALFHHKFNLVIKMEHLAWSVLDFLNLQWKSAGYLVQERPGAISIL